MKSQIYHCNVPISSMEHSLPELVGDTTRSLRLRLRYRGIGRANYSKSNYAAALTYSEKALPILRNALGDDHPDVAEAPGVERKVLEFCYLNFRSESRESLGVEFLG